MRQHRDLFESVRKRTGMYVEPPTYDSVAAFVQGYDTACEGGVLAGFREWLVMRLGYGSNLSWPPLVLGLAFPDAPSPQDALSTEPAVQRHAIDTLFNLLAEFDSVRAKHDGLKDIFVAYERWTVEAAKLDV